MCSFILEKRHLFSTYLWTLRYIHQGEDCSLWSVVHQLLCRFAHTNNSVSLKEYYRQLVGIK